jgi:sugar/nucleoside kinase (ribokinase family)
MALDQLAVEGYGVLTPRVREELANIAAANPKLIVYADSRSFISKFRNMIIKCNDHEAMHIIHPEKTIAPDAAIDTAEAGACLLELSKLSGKEVFVSCGSRGVLVKGAADPLLVPAVPVPPPIDIVGAGDACSSGIVSALCCGASPEEAAALGNIVASITIQVIGTTGTATVEQVRERFKAYASGNTADHGV